MGKLISIDFDGTITKSSFPDLGEPQEGAMETMRDLIAAGYLLILNTCRENEKRRAYLTEAVNFCRSHGVEFVSVNENRPEDEFRDKPGRKVYASVYIDDRNFGGFPGWAKVREAFGLPPLNSQT
jgi:hypothetical protein